MHRFPVFLSLGGRPCVVVGGSALAAPKVEMLLAADAQVTVVARELAPELAALVEGHTQIRWLRRDYRAGDLAGSWLVFLASPDSLVGARVARDAQDARVWLNAIDEPERCSLTMPAVLRRGRITVAVGTGGASPLLARVLRDDIGSWLGGEYAAAADHLAKLRARFTPGPARQRAFQALIAEGLLPALRVDDRKRVDEITEAACAGLERRSPPGSAGP
jgi:siroheme synthase-like protein